MWLDEDQQCLVVGTLEVAGQAGKVLIWEPFLHTSIQCSPSVLVRRSVGVLETY